jgi:hypothetical protein
MATARPTLANKIIGGLNDASLHDLMLQGCHEALDNIPIVRRDIYQRLKADLSPDLISAAETIVSFHPSAPPREPYNSVQSLRFSI